MFVFGKTNSKLKAKAVILGLVFIGLIFIDNQNIGVSAYNPPAPIERVATEKKVIALTINVDWGEEYIPGILAILEQHQAKATFFITGRWAQKNPSVLKNIVEKGHQVENHGFSHPHPDQLSIARNKEEILKTEKIIESITGEKTHFYAPPYGERGKSGLQAADELGYTTILWTFDTIDWRTDSTPELIWRRVIEPKPVDGIVPEKRGAIVLMHPKENTVKALPAIVKSLQDEQYSLVTLEKLITS